MNKFSFALLSVLFVVLACVAAESASVGAPGIQPGRGRFIFGLEYSSMSSREFFDENFSAGIVDTDAAHFLAKMKYGFSDRITLYAKAGSSDLNIYNSTSYPNSSEIGYGAGVDFILFEDLQTGLSLIAGAQYYTYEPKSLPQNSFKWEEWDASIKMLIVNYVADPMALIEPFALTHATFYSGVRYSDARINWTRGINSGTLVAEDTFGLFVGVDFVFNDNYIITLEGRFRDEEALTAAMGFKF